MEPRWNICVRNQINERHWQTQNKRHQQNDEKETKYDISFFILQGKFITSSCTMRCYKGDMSIRERSTYRTTTCMPEWNIIKNSIRWLRKYFLAFFCLLFGDAICWYCVATNKKNIKMKRQESFWGMFACLCVFLHIKHSIKKYKQKNSYPSAVM